MQAGVNACGKREGNHVQIVYSYDIYEGNLVPKKQRISFAWGGAEYIFSAISKVRPEPKIIFRIGKQVVVLVYSECTTPPPKCLHSPLGRDVIKLTFHFPQMLKKTALHFGSIGNKCRLSALVS